MFSWSAEAERLIRIGSVSADGNEELVNYLAVLLQKQGFTVNLQQVMHSLEGISKRQFNIIAVLGDPLVDRKIKKGLLLQTHLDTPRPGNPELWTDTHGDPFAAIAKGGKIYGLGAAEAKLDFLCKVKAASKFRERKLKEPIYLVGTCGEELGMFGISYLLSSYTVNPKMVLVGAPTGLKLIGRHKAVDFYRTSIQHQVTERDVKGFNRRVLVTSNGEAIHSAYPERGKNAIVQMFQVLGEAMRLGFELKFSKILGGSLSNRVPDQASAEFYLTSHQFEDFKRFFRETVRSLGTDGKVDPLELNIGGLGQVGVSFIPDDGIRCVFDVLKNLEETSKKFVEARNPSFFPNHSTLSLSRIEQNYGRIDLFFETRLLPGSDGKKINSELLDFSKSLSTKYRGLNVFSTNEKHCPALSIDPADPWVKTCLEAGAEVGMREEVLSSSLCTEAGHFHSRGYSALVFGPGESLDIKGVNEYNSILEMEKAVSYYEKIIEKVCF